MSAAASSTAAPSATTRRIVRFARGSIGPGDYPTAPVPVQSHCQHSYTGPAGPSSSRVRSARSVALSHTRMSFREGPTIRLLEAHPDLRHGLDAQQAAAATAGVAARTVQLRAGAWVPSSIGSGRGDHLALL